MIKTNQKKIELVFKDNYKEFCLLSFSYVACMDQAKDIVQDVFVKLLLKGDVMNVLNLKGYIWKAVKNSSLTYVTRAKKMEPIEKCNLILVDEIDDRNQELDLKIQNALVELPPHCKNVFELCVISGQKYDDAAESLGISKNTVKTQMKKAYKILRYKLVDVYFLILFFSVNL